jgi:hypothetical protein
MATFFPILIEAGPVLLEYLAMRLSSFDEFRNLEGNEAVGDHDLIPPDFPHVVMVECDYPDLDVATRWCWKCFGPQQGNCLSSYSEYPACPIVLATARQGVRVGPDSKAYQIMEYDHVVPHMHSGKWIVQWLEKTEYNHGFAEFCFQSESDKEMFMQQIPSFDWGENYPWLIEDSTSGSD